MNELSQIYDDMKAGYRAIFTKSVDAIKERVEELRPLNFEGDIFDKFEINSVGAQWQNAVIEMFEKDICREIYEKWQEILAFRNNFECKGCAVCCQLACCEYSPEELQKRAQSGDDFAKQFTGIFVPYQNREEAEKVYPEYLQLLSENIDDDVYFYHCPKLDCNRCSDYENRPAICRQFPDNPLDILPESCGFYQWRKEVEPIAMTLHAMMEIIDYYKTKINILPLREDRNL